MMCASGGGGSGLYRRVFKILPVWNLWMQGGDVQN